MRIFATSAAGDAPGPIQEGTSAHIPAQPAAVDHIHYRDLKPVVLTDEEQVQLRDRIYALIELGERAGFKVNVSLQYLTTASAWDLLVDGADASETIERTGRRYGWRAQDFGIHEVRVFTGDVEGEAA